MLLNGLTPGLDFTSGTLLGTVSTITADSTVMVLPGLSQKTHQKQHELPLAEAA